MPILKSHQTAILMKVSIIITFFGLYLSAFCQIEAKKIELSTCNNGNIEKEIDQFYFNPVAEYGPGDDVYNYKETSFKFNLYFGVLTKGSWEFGLSAGYGKRFDEYEVSNLPNWTGDKIQKFYSASLLTKYNICFNRFELGTGIELPLSLIRNHTTNYYQNDPNQTAHFRYVVTGGKVFGLNSHTSLLFYLKDWIYLTSKISFGYSFLKAGGTGKYELVSQIPDSYQNVSYEIKSIYKKSYFSSPNIQIGIGCRF